MSRWSQYDEDEYRLPEGMRRVGYDADTQRFTYQDTDGSYWEGPEGSRYGELRKVGEGEPPAAEDDEHLLGTSPSSHQQPKHDYAWRMFAPFMLLICAFLLGVYLLVGGRLWFFGGSTSVVTCTPGQSLYKVQKGDTCWDISETLGMSLQQLESMNGDLDCDALKIGQQICVVKG